MAGALFAIDQDRPGGPSFGTPGVPRKDLWLARTIRPAIASPTGNNTYLWELLDCPLDSNLRSSPGGPILPIPGFDTATPNFDPDKYGPYRLRCTTNGGGPGNVVTLVCHVRFDFSGVLLRQGRMLPSFGEVASEDDFTGDGRGYATQFEDTELNTRTRIEALEALVGGAVPPGSETQIAFSNGTSLDFDARLEFVQNVAHSELHLGVKALLDAHNTSFRIFASSLNDDEDGVTLELHGGDGNGGLGGDVLVQAGGSSDIGFKSGNLIFQAGDALNGGEPGDIYLSPGASGIRTGNTVIGTQEVIDFKSMQQGVFLAADAIVRPIEDPSDVGLFLWSTAAGSLVTRGSGGLMKLGDRILDMKLSAPTLTLDADLVTWPSGILGDIRPSATGFGLRLSVTGSGQFIRLETTQSSSSVQIYSSSVQYSNNIGSPAANLTPTGLRLGDFTPSTERLEVMGNVAIDVATVGPKFYQKDNVTNSAVAEAFTVQAANATGTGATGGTLVLASGTGTLVGGDVHLKVATSGLARVTVGGIHAARIGMHSDAPTVLGALWLGSASPTATNYAINSEGLTTTVNSGDTTSSIAFAVGNVLVAAISGTTSSPYAAPGLFLWKAIPADAVIGIHTTTSNSVTGKSLTIQAQNATGTTTTGGNLTLTSGSGTTAPGTVRLATGGSFVMILSSTQVTVSVPTVSFSSSIVPVIKQNDLTTNSGTGAAFTIQAQNETGTTSIGGDLNLTSGTGTSLNGVVNLKYGGVTKLTVNATGATITGTLSATDISVTGTVTANSSGGKAILTGLTGFTATFGALYLGAITPSATNYALTSDGTAATWINVPTGGSILFSINNSATAVYTSTGLRLGAGFASEKLHVDGNVCFDTAVTTPKLYQRDNTTNSATATSLTLQAQNATGTSASGGALDLRSGTGTLTDGNIVLRTGTTTRLSLSPTAASFTLVTVQWSTAVLAPTLKQADNTTNSATAAALTIQAANATGTTAIGGDLNLTSGTGTSAAGVVNLQSGASTLLTVNSTGATTTGTLTANSGGAKAVLSGLVGSLSTIAALYLGVATPSATNHTIYGTGTSTNIQAPGVGTISFTINNSGVGNWNSTGLIIGSGGTPLDRLHVIGNVAIDTTTTTPKVYQRDNTTNSATATSLTIQAANATGTTSTGGNLELTSGTGTTASGAVKIMPDRAVATVFVSFTGSGGTLTQTIAGGGNFVFSGTGAMTFKTTVASPSGAFFAADVVYFQNGAQNQYKGVWTSTGLLVGDSGGTAAVEKLEVRGGNIAFGTATTTPKVYQLDNTTNSATATSLTIQAQNATGTTSTGGQLNLTSGTGTTIAGSVTLQTGGTTRLLVAPAGITLGTSAQVHQFVGGIRYTVRSIAGTVTLDTTTTDYLLRVDTSAARSITLPAPASGRMFLLQDATGTCGTNTITLIRNGSEKIQGLTASYIFATDWGAWLIWSDGTDWFIK